MGWLHTNKYMNICKTWQLIIFAHFIVGYAYHTVHDCIHFSKLFLTLIQNVALNDIKCAKITVIVFINISDDWSTILKWLWHLKLEIILMCVQFYLLFLLLFFVTAYILLCNLYIPLLLFVKKIKVIVCF